MSGTSLLSLRAKSPEVVLFGYRALIVETTRYHIRIRRPICWSARRCMASNEYTLLHISLLCDRRPSTVLKVSLFCFLAVVS
jgi:hypothetical protein